MGIKAKLKYFSNSTMNPYKMPLYTLSIPVGFNGALLVLPNIVSPTENIMVSKPIHIITIKIRYNCYSYTSLVWRSTWPSLWVTSTTSTSAAQSWLRSVFQWRTSLTQAYLPTCVRPDKQNASVLNNNLPSEAMCSVSRVYLRNKHPLEMSASRLFLSRDVIKHSLPTTMQNVGFVCRYYCACL